MTGAVGYGSTLANLGIVLACVGVSALVATLALYPLGAWRSRVERRVHRCDENCDIGGYEIPGATNCYSLDQMPRFTEPRGELRLVTPLPGMVDSAWPLPSVRVIERMPIDPVAVGWSS